jgi:hypothetical protein
MTDMIAGDDSQGLNDIWEYNISANAYITPSMLQTPKASTLNRTCSTVHTFHLFDV